MEISENKFTNKFTISSQKIGLCRELIANQNAAYALVHSNMNVNLKNKPGEVKEFSNEGKKEWETKQFLNSFIL